MGGATTLDRGRAGMGFVNDHKLGASSQKLVAAAVRLDEVRGDYHERMSVED
jgi:hypothetical protein